MKALQNAVRRLEKLLGFGGTKKDIVFLVLGGISLLCDLFVPQVFPFDYAWIAVIFCGIPIVLEAIIGLITAFDIKADVLVSMALIASLCTGEYFAAGEVAFIMQLGALLEDLTVARARAGIEKLVKLSPQTARVLEGDNEKIVPVEEVQVGATVRVIAGEMIPVDGVILSGETAVNQAVMTGESLPVDKAPGDTVSSGTVNQFGVFTMRATKVGADSSIQRMIRLVQSASADKAKIVGIADRWATWVVVIALVSAAITWAITGLVIRAVTILVVFCPCALVLATPTAIMAAIGNATKHGFLVREGDALERLSSVQKICFDKTGTLTYGTPVVIAARALGTTTEKELYAYTASAELSSEHPLGKAVVKCFQDSYGENPPPSENFRLEAGRGAQATCKNRQVYAGNARFLDEQGLSVPETILQEAATYTDKGATAIFTAVDGVLAGYLILSDTIREDSPQMLQGLADVGVQPILMTGDHTNAANAIAGQLHIAEVVADCLPEEKMKKILELEKSGTPVCMIGDGINDAPALKVATTGIAMGGIGSDIAVEAADIALVHDDIKELPHLLRLSKRMMITIRCNLTFSMTLNFVAIILAMTGILNPVIGALVHNAGSVLVICISATLLRWKKREHKPRLSSSETPVPHPGF